MLRVWRTPGRSCPGRRRRALKPVGLLAVLGTILSMPPPARAQAPPGPPVHPPPVQVLVDPRVELVSIVFRLAGHPEYNRGRIPSYVADVEERFGSLRGHPVVELARRLRHDRGVSFDACMSLAVHLADVESCAERVPFEPRPVDLDARWRPQEARDFTAHLRDFAKVGRFAEFFTAHRKLYDTAETRMRTLLGKDGHLEWFDQFFGERPGARFTVALALLNGPNNYGPHCLLPDGKDDLYCILGAWARDAEGLPVFVGSEAVQTVVHEFVHSYANPFVDRHAAELKPAAETLFAQVSEGMGRQAYGNWKTMLYESLVRACTIRYVRRHQGQFAALVKINEEKRRQFLWAGELSDLLGEYESQRGRYATLESFAPRVVAFFNAYADKHKAPAGKLPAGSRD